MSRCWRKKLSTTNMLLEQKSEKIVVLWTRYRYIKWMPSLPSEQGIPHRIYMKTASGLLMFHHLCLLVHWIWALCIMVGQPASNPVSLSPHSLLPQFANMKVQSSHEKSDNDMEFPNHVVVNKEIVAQLAAKLTTTEHIIWQSKDEENLFYKKCGDLVRLIEYFHECSGLAASSSSGNRTLAPKEPPDHVEVVKD